MKIAEIFSSNDPSRTLLELIPFSTDDQKDEIFNTTDAIINLISSTLEFNPVPLNKIDLLAKISFLIAECAKDETIRNKYINTKIHLQLGKLMCFCSGHLQPELIIKKQPALTLKRFLPKSVEEENSLNELKIQNMRAFANLCCDNEGNRDLFYETQISIPFLVANLKSSNAKVIQVALGCLLNVSMDNEPIQMDVIEYDGLEILLVLSSQYVGNFSSADYNFELGTGALRILSNLVECEIGAKALLKPIKSFDSNGLKLVTNLIKCHHSNLLSPNCTVEEYKEGVEILELLATILENVGEDVNVQRAIVREDLLDVFLNFVDHIPKDKSCLDNEDEELGEAPTFGAVRKVISKITTLVTMNDENMKDLPHSNSLICRLKNWMGLGHAGDGGEREEDEIRMAAALCIGNLARSDESCEILVKSHNIVENLLNLMHLEMKRLNPESFNISFDSSNEDKKHAKDEIKSIIQVLHAVVGSLRNLSLAANVRNILGEIGVIEAIGELLEKGGIKIAQLGGVTILKNLAKDNLQNCYRIITGEAHNNSSLSTTEAALPTLTNLTPLQKMISLVWKAVEDNDSGIRNEGGRCISNLVRCCHYSKVPKLVNYIIEAKGVPPLIQIVTGAILTKQKTLNTVSHSNISLADVPRLSVGENIDNHVHFDALPVETAVFPNVQNEGIVALILMCSANPHVAFNIIKFYSSLIPTVCKIIQSGINTESIEVARLESTGVNISDITEKTKENFIYPNEIKVNACLLLETLCKAEENFKIKVSSDCLESFSKVDKFNHLKKHEKEKEANLMEIETEESFLDSLSFEIALKQLLKTLTQ
ncbi:hypothetical protein HK099_006536 [Clydaea vesicula]|uniref:Uncharacterized protein n=1 Tax=Clydaea vesicula TaxID=447962 RepID=A0AAD5U9X9_9FUNG|nr:hypothetical protein HK099_006536 [Clydaea vesicula]